jgi:glycosyltransferase involved in cell wall biosynthesis
MKLVLAGERGIGKAQDVYDQLLILISEHKLEGRVLLPGYVTNEQLGALYRNSLAYIFPSFDEGFGIPVLEAFHSKVPVIISNRGSLPEVAEDAALVFDADDDEALFEEMKRLSDEDLRQTLINKGSRRLEAFSKDKFTRSFDDVIARYVVNKPT